MDLKFAKADQRGTAGFHVRAGTAAETASETCECQAPNAQVRPASAEADGFGGAEDLSTGVPDDFAQMSEEDLVAWFLAESRTAAFKAVLDEMSERGTPEILSALARHIDRLPKVHRGLPHGTAELQFPVAVVLLRHKRDSVRYLLRTMVCEQSTLKQRVISARILRLVLREVDADDLPGVLREALTGENDVDDWSGDLRETLTDVDQIRMFDETVDLVNDYQRVIEILGLSRQTIVPPNGTLFD